MHGSEKALADLACEALGHNSNLWLLIGGLGMDLTLAAALKAVGPDAEVITAELVPEVVTWNRTLIGAPLNEHRSRIEPARGRAITTGSVHNASGRQPE